MHNIEQIPSHPGIESRTFISQTKLSPYAPPTLASFNQLFSFSKNSYPYPHAFLFTYIRELPNTSINTIFTIFSPFTLIPATSSHFLLEANKFFLPFFLVFFFLLFFRLRYFYPTFFFFFFRRAM